MIVSVFLDVISHTIKEALVRSQPLNQENFNLQIGIFQLCMGILLFPLVKLIAQTLSKEDSPFYGEPFDTMNAMAFSGVYLKHGLACVFNVGTEEADPKYSNGGLCAYSWASIIGYTVSLFVIQLTLNSIMSHKFTRHAQVAQSFLVPISVLAFYLGARSLPI